MIKFRKRFTKFIIPKAHFARGVGLFADAEDYSAFIIIISVQISSSYSVDGLIVLLVISELSKAIRV